MSRRQTSRNAAKYMDHRQAPLNPCSVETIPLPISLRDGRNVWPLMLSCYQLEEDSEKKGCRRRLGHMDLSLIQVPDIINNLSGMPLRFDSNQNQDDEPCVVMDHTSSSGILDGKWRALGGDQKSWAFASAHSTGVIHVHAFRVADDADEGTHLDSDPLFQIEFMGQTDPPTAATTTTDSIPPLCLSLSWDSQAACKPDISTTTAEGTIDKPARIVSSYSNGTLAIHDVSFGSQLESTALFIERDSWHAHTMFNTPAEVWSACFLNRDVVLSGGDEGKLKVWDIRALQRPSQIISDPFEAGVTCLSPHPSLEHIVAAGSYDETISLFDFRFLDPRKPLCHTGCLGGGIWRIKWHPLTAGRMLVGAMHGGCRVLNFGGLSSSSSSSSSDDTSSSTEGNGNPEHVGYVCTKKFTEHESMVYGADWLICPHPTQNGYFEAAARYVVAPPTHRVLDEERLTPLQLFILRPSCLSMGYSLLTEFRSKSVYGVLLFDGDAIEAH